MVVVVISFMVSRLYYWAIGVRFDATTLDIFNQILDRVWLKERLWESLVYSHGQPPLLNLLIGLTLKIDDSASSILLPVIFAALGLLLVVSLYQLLILLGVSPRWGVAACLLWCFSPAPVLYENWLMNTYPVASLLIAGFWLLARFMKQGDSLSGFLAAALLSMVALLRASYHLVWLAGLILLAWRFAPVIKRRTILLLLLPCLLVGGWYIKNALVFGTFSASSWLGMNWYNVVARDVPDDLRQSLLAAGQLQVQAKPFVDLNHYGAFALHPEFEAIPALNASTKSSGTTNFNHYAFLEIAQRFLHDDWVLLRACPLCYLRAVGQAGQIYLWPASDYVIFNYNPHNVLRTAAIRWAFDQILFGQVLSSLPNIGDKSGLPSFPVLLIAIPATLLGGAMVVVKLLRQSDGRAGPLLAIVGTCWFISLVNVLFDVSENNRYRFEIDPVLYAVAVFLFWTLTAGHRHHRMKVPQIAMLES